MTRTTIAVLASALIATPALAGITNSASYGWDDGSASILGGFNNEGMFYENSADTVFGSFMAWDDSFGASSSLRIWGSYTDDPSDITSYAGSAGGNSTYSGAEGGDLWQELSHTRTFDSNGGERDGLVIQIRMYANSGGHPGLYVDDLYVETSSETAVINVAPAPGALALLGLAGIAGRRRRG